MEEETITKYELTDRDQEIRQQMLDLMNKPKFVQNFMYHSDGIPKIYNARVIVDKPDRISVIDKSFGLRIGTNGLFIKQGMHNSGVTYHKKGRSSARVRYWGTKNGGNRNSINQYDTLKGIAKEINPDCMDILNKEVIKQIATQGMLGSIIAGKTDTLTKAMEYYIRYSLRGVGVDMSQAMNLYSFIDGMQYGVYSGIKALRVAKDPNEVLELAMSTTLDHRLRIMVEQGSVTTDLALMVGEKVDWASPTFNIDREYSRLVKKKERISSQLRLWEGGPILEDKTPPLKATNKMSPASLGNNLPF
jgi:hypothetical protein